MQKFRIVFVGSNKQFKQQLVSDIVGHNIYQYSIIDRQTNIYVFRKADKDCMSKAMLPQNTKNFQKTKEWVPISERKSFVPYLQHYQKQNKLTETIFLFDLTNMLEQPIEIIDMPHLYEFKNQQQMYLGAETASTIQPNVIVIAIDQREYFKQNLKNIKRGIFGNQNDGTFGNAKLIWVIKEDSSGSEIPDLLQKETDMVMLYNRDRWREAFLREVPRLVYITQEQQPEYNYEKQQLLDRAPVSPPLFLTRQEISSMSAQRLNETLDLLRKPTESLAINDYNYHMSTLGCNMRLTSTTVDYKRQIFMFLLLSLVTVYTGLKELLLLAILIVIVAISRTRQMNIHNMRVEEEQRKRHTNRLFGPDGIITCKITEIQKELLKR